MNADVAAAVERTQKQRSAWLLWLLGLSQFVLVCATDLWITPHRFPQVPLLSVVLRAPRWAAAADFLLYQVLLVTAILMLVSRHWDPSPLHRVNHAVSASVLTLLFVLNQHRLQPWAYQFFVLHAWLAFSSPKAMLAGWRWLTISIYVYSALSKFDYAFCTNHGPFLLEGFLHSLRFADVRLSPSVSFVLSALMPLTELFTAILLCFPRTQRVGLYFSIAMHLFLIIALGPLGHDHSAGVLIWNAFFIVQNWLLFAPTRGMESSVTTDSPLSLTLSPGAGARGQSQNQIAAWVLLAFVLISPLGEPFGFWDHWPSWAVYAARPEQVVVAIHEDDLPRVPGELQKYLQPPTLLEPWHPVRFDRWSIDATRAPIYPQSRFHVGVALALAERCDLTTLRVTIFRSPNRWTGQRERKDFIGLDAVQELAETYACNAQPRH